MCWLKSRKEFFALMIFHFTSRADVEGCWALTGNEIISFFCRSEKLVRLLAGKVETENDITEIHIELENIYISLFCSELSGLNKHWYFRYISIAQQCWFIHLKSSQVFMVHFRLLLLSRWNRWVGRNTLQADDSIEDSGASEPRLRICRIWWL